jgi:hypothetical protein
MDEELLLRAPTDNDWPVIAELADTAVEQVLGAPVVSIFVCEIAGEGLELSEA